ncbi:DUF3592 domain-containing protein [Streptomyces sp. JNUCC 64]
MDWYDWHGYLALWCGVFGVLALIGYGRSLAGVNRARRAVRVMGRIERVRPPRHGGSWRDGIAVVVTFRDPSTGREHTVTNDRDRGVMIDAAWEGREVPVSYPGGRPFAYRFTHDLHTGRYGLGWPHTALFLVYAGLVVGASVEWGWPWALIGVFGPWTVCGILYLPGSVSGPGRALDELGSGPPVPGRVVAVLEDVSTDEDGHTMTRHTPVVSFTTRQGVTVTAYRTSGLTDPARSFGRDVTVHYAPADPARFTLDLAADRRSRWSEVAFALVAFGLGAAAVVVGAVLLW